MVVVTNMDMPEYCYQCKLCNPGHSYCNGYNGFLPLGKTKREEMEKCPLRSIDDTPNKKNTMEHTNIS